MLTAKSSPIALRLRAAASASIAIKFYCRVQIRKYSSPTDLPVPNKKKVWASAEEAIGGDAIKSGDTLLCAGVFSLIFVSSKWLAETVAL